MKAPFIFCAIMLAFASCKKEKTTLNNNTIPPESTTENPYQPLNEGNYWGMKGTTSFSMTVRSLQE